MNKKTENMNRMIGNRIASFRHSLGMTQEELAEKMDISVTFLSEIENGRKSMSVNTLVKLSRSLHVSTDAIIFGVNTSGDITEDVASIMSGLPLEYNESILIIARELAKLHQKRLSSAEAAASIDNPSHSFTLCPIITD